MGWRYPDRLHHASQGRLGPPQWRTSERSRDRCGTLHPAYGWNDLDDGDYRSRLFDRTHGADARVRVRRGGSDWSVSMRARGRNRPAKGRDPASFAGNESILEGIRREAQSAARRRAWRRGNDVSRISTEDETMK